MSQVSVGRWREREVTEANAVEIGRSFVVFNILSYGREGSREFQEKYALCLA